MAWAQVPGSLLLGFLQAMSHDNKGIKPQGSIDDQLLAVKTTGNLTKKMKSSEIGILGSQEMSETQRKEASACPAPFIPCLE